MKIRTRKKFIKKYIIIIYNNKSNKNVDSYYSIIKKLIFKYFFKYFEKSNIYIINKYFIIKN